MKHLKFGVGPICADSLCCTPIFTKEINGLNGMTFYDCMSSLVCMRRHGPRQAASGQAQWATVVGYSTPSTVDVGGASRSGKSCARDLTMSVWVTVSQPNPILSNHLSWKIRYHFHRGHAILMKQWDNHPRSVFRNPEYRPYDHIVGRSHLLLLITP